MGGRDHSETCATCGWQRGGLNDDKCRCDQTEAAEVLNTVKLYAKKREPLRAVQWIGNSSLPAVRALIAPREAKHAQNGDLELGAGWYARRGDWVVSESGEDIGVLSDAVFRQVYEEVASTGPGEPTRTPPTDADHDAAGKAFVKTLDVLLCTGLRLSPADHPDVFQARNALVYELRRLLEEFARVRSILARDLKWVTQEQL